MKARKTFVVLPVIFFPNIYNFYHIFCIPISLKSAACPGIYVCARLIIQRTQETLIKLLDIWALGLADVASLTLT